MLDNCTNCRLYDEISDLKKSKEKLEERVTYLERQGDKNEERVDMIFKILNEIKNDIRSITLALDMIKQKPAKTFEKLQYKILEYIVVAALAYFAAQYFK